VTGNGSNKNTKKDKDEKRKKWRNDRLQKHTKKEAKKENEKTIFAAMRIDC